MVAAHENFMPRGFVARAAYSLVADPTEAFCRAANKPGHVANHEGAPATPPRPTIWQYSQHKFVRCCPPSRLSFSFLPHHQ
jgi:hypothetical protein